MVGDKAGLDSDLEDKLKSLLRDKLLSFEFGGKKETKCITKIRCPSCGKKEAYAYVSKPFVMYCNRKNNCSSAQSGITYKTFAPDIKESIWDEQKRRRYVENKSYCKSFSVKTQLVVKQPPVYIEPVKADKTEVSTRIIENYDSIKTLLPGSLGQKYLEHRGISLEIAKKYGLGYASNGKWPHIKDGKPVMQWKYGRVTFPHTNALGEVVNLYGRAIGNDEHVPKQIKHAHLPGPRGVFNAVALSQHTAFICEGAFDALSLISAGFENSCAIFGIYGLKWEMVKADRIIFCLDQDDAGSHWKELAWDGLTLGKEILWLPEEVYKGCKDLNETWIKHRSFEISV